MPEDRAARRLGFAARRRQKTHAVLRRLHGGQSAGLDDGAEDVRCADEAGAGGAGLHLAGPADKERLAHAAFVEPAFAAAQRLVAGGPAFARAQAAVVAGKDDKRFLRETERVEPGQHRADRAVHRLDHRAIDGEVLREPHLALAFETPVIGGDFLRALLVFLHQLGLAHERRMHIVKPVAHEERLVLVCLDELPALRRQPVGEVLAIRAVGQLRIAVGREILLPAVRAAAVESALVHIEALRLREKLLAAEMPFARVHRGVTSGLEHLGQRGFFKRELLGVGCGQQLRRALPLVRLRGADVIRHACPLRPASGEQRCARGRTHRAGRIRLRELHPLLRHAVEMRRVVERAAVAPEVALAQIVGEEDDDVGPLGSGDRIRQRSDHGAGEEDEVNKFHWINWWKVSSTSADRSASRGTREIYPSR